jgi:hypothetical protein
MTVYGLRGSVDSRFKLTHFRLGVRSESGLSRTLADSELECHSALTVTVMVRVGPGPAATDSDSEIITMIRVGQAADSVPVSQEYIY